MTAAYMTARLGLIGDPKHFPDLEDFLPDDARPDVEQSSAEFSASFLKWAIANGAEPDNGTST